MSTTLHPIPEPRERRSMMWKPSRNHLLPRQLAGMPDTVADANARATDLFDRYDAAQEALREAAAAAEKAPRLDEMKARVAVEADEPAPAPTVADKKAAQDAAEQHVEAVRHTLQSAILALFDAVRMVRPEWYADLLARAEVENAALSDALDAVRDAFIRVEVNRDLVRLLPDFDGNPKSSHLSIHRRSSATTLPASEAKAAVTLKASHQSTSPVPRELPYLFAALRLAILDQPAPRAHGTVGW